MMAPASSGKWIAVLRINARFILATLIPKDMAVPSFIFQAGQSQVQTTISKVILCVSRQAARLKTGEGAPESIGVIFSAGKRR